MKAMQTTVHTVKQHPYDRYQQRNTYQNKSGVYESESHGDYGDKIKRSYREQRADKGNSRHSSRNREEGIAIANKLSDKLGTQFVFQNIN